MGSMVISHTTGTRGLVADYGSRRLSGIEYLDDVLELAAGRPEISSAWLHSSALRPLKIGKRWPACSYDAFPAGEAPSGYQSFTVGDRRIGLAIPSLSQDETPLHPLAPHELARVLDRYAELIGLEYAWSPHHTAYALIDKLHTGRTVEPPVRRSSHAALCPPAAHGSTEVDLRWTSHHLPRWSVPEHHVVELDQRSRYLTSCSTVELGTGIPSHLRAGGLDLAGEILENRDASNLLPGYYLARFYPGHEALLDPLPAVGSDAVWITKPTLELALNLGRLRAVEEAYVYQRSSRYLRSFYDHLRPAFAAVGDAKSPERELLKQTVSQMIGALDGYWRKPGDRYFRPDWRHAIVAQSRAATYYGIRKLQAELSIGVEPAAVDVDAVFFVVTNGGLGRIQAAADAGELGTWKLEGIGEYRELDPDLPTITQLKAMTREPVRI